MTQGVQGQTVIDCDIHNQIPGPAALSPYPSELWHETIEQTGFKGPAAADGHEHDPSAPPGRVKGLHQAEII